MGIALLIMLNYTCSIIFIIKRLSSFKNYICYDIYDIVVIPFLFLLHIDISDYVSYIMENIFGFTIVILCDVFVIRNKVFVSCIFVYIELVDLAEWRDNKRMLSFMDEYTNTECCWHIRFSDTTWYSCILLLDLLRKWVKEMSLRKKP